MPKLKVTPTRILVAGAAQIIITTIGFILYNRPYLWAITALEWYSEEYCGQSYHSASNRYNALPANVQAKKIHLTSTIHKRSRECRENYLQSFSDMFHEQCSNFDAKAAFITIPLVSAFLISGIFLCLHWAPFHKKTLKKPAFMVSFLFSLVLVAVNLGEIITIIVPLINDNASPDKQIENNGDKDTMICGHGAETAALILMSISSGLSILIAFFIIKLYIARIRGQKDNLTEDKLRIETMEEYIEEKETAKLKKKHKKNFEKSEYFDANDASFMNSRSNENLYSGSPVKTSDIPHAGAKIRTR